MGKTGKRVIAIIITVVCVAAIALAVVLWRRSGTTDDDNVAYVQTVRSLQYEGVGNSGGRLSGVVESQAAVEVKADSSRTIKDVYVTVGQSVTAGERLFSYDVSEAQNSQQSLTLDIEGLNNDIAAVTNEIADLNEAKKGADAQTALDYTTQIQDKQMQIRQDQLDIQSKNNEIASYQRTIDNSTVTAPSGGVVRSLNPSGTTNSNGTEQPVVSIAATSEMQVRGTVSEQNVSQVNQGSSAIIRSREDETRTWAGTVARVDTEPQTSDSAASSYSGYDSGGGQSSSKYNFYVTLEKTDGLMLGQHVYVEIGEPGAANIDHSGIWLDQSFILTDDDGTSYVWKDNKGRLAKQTVTTGDTDDDLMTVRIDSGLTMDDLIAYPDDTFTVGTKTQKVGEES